MAKRAALISALKVFAVAFFGFLACCGTGALLNGVTGAVWGIGVGIIFWLWLASLFR